MITFHKLGQYGRLGNQLFQMAATMALAIENNDTYVFPKWPYESYFNISNCFSNNVKYNIIYEEKSFEYTPIPYKKNMSLFGYFQSYKYFNHCSGHIVKAFTSKKEYTFKKDTASIHVRRTDYLNFPNHHPTQNMEYYENAMKITGAKHFIIFSDDISWCKQHFIGNQFEFSEGNSDIVDLSLQTKCAHNIIANSSFSWWAAYLNKNPNKIVIAPKKWFGPALSSHNTKDLYLPDWHVI